MASALQGQDKEYKKLALAAIRIIAEIENAIKAPGRLGDTIKRKTTYTQWQWP